MIAAAILAAASVATDPGLLRVTERAKACIAESAAEVERSDPSLSSAADFLLNHLCAIPVRTSAQYRRSAELLATYRQTPSLFDPGDDADPQVNAKRRANAERQMDAYNRATISEETGEILLPKDLGAPTLFAITAPYEASPELRAFAGRALLDARKARHRR